MYVRVAGWLQTRRLCPNFHKLLMPLPVASWLHLKLCEDGEKSHAFVPVVSPRHARRCLGRVYPCHPPPPLYGVHPLPPCRWDCILPSRSSPGDPSQDRLLKLDISTVTTTVVAPAPMTRMNVVGMNDLAEQFPKLWLFWYYWRSSRGGRYRAGDNIRPVGGDEGGVGRGGSQMVSRYSRKLVAIDMVVLFWDNHATPSS